MRYESQLLEAATKLQMKAAKSDLVFRMIDSFNRNTVQVTVTWTLKNCYRGIIVIIIIITIITIIIIIIIIDHH